MDASDTKEPTAVPSRPNKTDPTSIVATHLPTDATKKELMDFFSEIGPVRNCHLVRDKGETFIFTLKCLFVMYHIFLHAVCNVPCL